ncbi:DUF6445 family protein [Chitinimonas naiadis]
MSKAQQLVEQGVLLHQQGKVREASSYFQQALGVQPNFGPAQYYLGLSLAQQGMVDMGRLMIEKALAGGEDHPALRLDLGLMLERAGQMETASRHFQRAAELAPQNLHAWEALARVQERLGNAAAAAAALAQLLELRPGHLATQLAMARHAWRHNRVDETRQYFEAMLAEHPAALDQAYLGFAEPVLPPSVADAYPLLQRDAAADDDEIRLVLAGADLVILDNFLPDPDETRQWAAGLDYVVQNGNYPGAQTGPLRCDELMQRIADRLGRRIKWSSPDNGVVRLTYANARARTDIHVDDETAVETQRYAAVLYLTLPPYCQGGTSFWRHRETGWFKRPDDATVRAAGFADFKTFLRRETPLGEMREFQRFAEQREKWQHLFTVPMQYNRLVLYKGNHFHAVDNVFGSNFEDGRLTRLMTFETW